MTREECEKKIAEYCSAIRLTMLEYNPNADYLSITFGKTRDGNDNGNWDVYYSNANNIYWDEDKDHPIYINTWKHIKDEKYWKCVTEEEDREADEEMMYDGSMLADGTILSHQRVDRG